MPTTAAAVAAQVEHGLPRVHGITLAFGCTSAGRPAACAVCGGGQCVRTCCASVLGHLVVPAGGQAWGTNFARLLLAEGAAGWFQPGYAAGALNWLVLMLQQLCPCPSAGQVVQDRLRLPVLCSAAVERIPPAKSRVHCCRTGGALLSHARQVHVLGRTRLSMKLGLEPFGFGAGALL